MLIATSGPPPHAAKQTTWLLSLALVLFLCMLAPVAAYSTSEGCSQRQEYLDPTSGSCQPCGADLVPLASGLGCRCKAGFRQEQRSDVRRTDGMAITCVACAAGAMVSPDGLACVVCGVSTTYESDAKICECAGTNSALTLTGADGTLAASAECITCSAGHTPSVLTHPPYIAGCLPCETPAMAAGTCACPLGQTKALGQCFVQTAALPSSAFSTIFGDGVGAIKSNLFETRLAAAISLCGIGNTTACQLLANLCVLQLYNVNHIACQKYRELAADAANNVNGWPDWPETLPWLYYTPGTAATRSKALALQGSFDTKASAPEVAFLRFVVATFDVQGQFLGTEDLTSQVQFCLQRPTLMRAFRRFGTTYRNRCTLALDSPELAQHPGLVFYEPYVVDVDEQLYPVPVLLRDYARDGFMVNQDGSAEQLQFVRRFFMLDNVSGIPPGATQPAAVRFATHIKLDIELQTSGKGKIYPPQFSISYSDVAAPYATGAALEVGSTSWWNRDRKEKWGEIER